MLTVMDHQMAYFIVLNVRMCVWNQETWFHLKNYLKTVKIFPEKNESHLKSL